MQHNIKFYNDIVKSTGGTDRHNEIITRTGWYRDTQPEVSPDQEIPRGRLVEMLKQLTNEKYENSEGISYYAPKVFLEITGRAKIEEKPIVAFIPIHTDARDPKLYERLERFAGAVKEFEAFRGYINDNGQKGSRETRYFKEIGARKNETGIKK
jgi:hypothetical protein